MLEQAIAKIRAEMEANKSDAYVQGAGTLLIRYLGVHPAASEKVLAKDVTLKKAVQAMEAEAKRRAVGVSNGRVCWMSDEEGMAIVLEYFGIQATPAETHAPLEAAVHKSTSAFTVNLDDLLRL